MVRTTLVWEGAALNIPDCNQPLMRRAELGRWCKRCCIICRRRRWVCSVSEQELRPCDEDDAHKTAHCKKRSEQKLFIRNVEECVRPARSSFLENGSFRKIALAMPVKMGARKVRTVASDRERYLREKYTPNRPKKLRRASTCWSPLTYT